jgi:plastocyanin
MAGRRTPAESLSGSASAVLLLISACAPSAPGAATPPADGVPPSSPVTPNAQATPSDEKGPLVLAADRFFVPDVMEVKSGMTVTWRNEGQEVHNIIANDGLFRSPDLAPYNTFSYTFNRPGRYRYACTYHAGDGMFGEVDVR